uniref:Fucosyltransferase n=1 Tax=Biomphalaria glabrata TaxID=6526 RepID=A0A2C9KG95_BIOGL
MTKLNLRSAVFIKHLTRRYFGHTRMVLIGVLLFVTYTLVFRKYSGAPVDRAMKRIDPRGKVVGTVSNKSLTLPAFSSQNNTSAVFVGVRNFISPFVVTDGDALNKASLGSECETSAGRDKFSECQGHRIQFVVKGAVDVRVKARTVAAIRSCSNGSRACIQSRKFDFKGCLYSGCLHTDDWKTADVLVIEAFYLQRVTILPRYKRPSHQRWVMSSMEAPCRHPQTTHLNSSQFDGQFNWSMTYNLDSDIPTLYGKLKVITPEPSLNYDAIFSTKTVHVAWFVSHCITSSLRQEYVARMRKIINIDIFGHCGSMNCSFGSNYRHIDLSHCLPLLSSTYFFYLAFENSICKDYVTEKVFKLFPAAKVIPVVRGGTDYRRYFPPETFVDASDFSTPEELAFYLVGLSKDKARYLRMLGEKSRYESVANEPWHCKLCEKMTKDDSVQWYPGNNMWAWFVQNKCSNPTNV